MTDHDDFAHEPVPGLPAPLPPGERLLWQGTPDWRRLAIDAFHCRKVAAYFAVIMLFVAIGDITGGAPWPVLIDNLLLTFWLGVGAVGLLTLLAWLSARSTIYSITTRRVLVRFGMALTMTVNLPFARIAGADVRVDDHGVGDIPLRLTERDRVNYLVMWPHVRPWKLARPEPMLRALHEVRDTAALLARAVAENKSVELGEAVAQHEVSAGSTPPSTRSVDPAGASRLIGAERLAPAEQRA